MAVAWGISFSKSTITILVVSVLIVTYATSFHWLKQNNVPWISTKNKRVQFYNHRSHFYVFDAICTICSLWQTLKFLLNITNRKTKESNTEKSTEIGSKHTNKRDNGKNQYDWQSLKIRRCAMTCLLRVFPPNKIKTKKIPENCCEINDESW